MDLCKIMLTIRCECSFVPLLARATPPAAPSRCKRTGRQTDIHYTMSAGPAGREIKQVNPTPRRGSMLQPSLPDQPPAYVVMCRPSPSISASLACRKIWPGPPAQQMSMSTAPSPHTGFQGACNSANIDKIFSSPRADIAAAHIAVALGTSAL